MTARVRFERRESEIVVSLEGEVDLSNIGAVEEEIRQALDDESRIVVDLTPTGYLDSSGLRMLFGLARSVGDRLSIVIPEGSHLRRVASTVGLSQVARVLPEPTDPPQA